jgi:hypothetical protein
VLGRHEGSREKAARVVGASRRLYTRPLRAGLTYAAPPGLIGDVKAIEERSFVAKDAPLDDAQIRYGDWTWVTGRKDPARRRLVVEGGGRAAALQRFLAERLIAALRLHPLFATFPHFRQHRSTSGNFGPLSSTSRDNRGARVAARFLDHGGNGRLNCLFRAGACCAELCESA